MSPIFQDIVAFEISGAPSGSVATVPTSYAGAAYPQDCRCNVYGGFEGSADGLLGCRPCKNGFFSAPNASLHSPPCSPCPLGTYAHRHHPLDLFAAAQCANSSASWAARRSLPVFMGQANYPDAASADSAAGQKRECGAFTVVGATHCTACPDNKPNTRSVPCLSLH